MKLRRWLLITLMVGLVGCGAEDDDGTIGGDDDPIQPGNTNGGTGGVGSTGSTGGFPPPTTGGTNPGTNGGTNGGSSNGDICEEQMVSSQRVPPEMLIVLDKSGSMGPQGNDQGIDRWGGSVDALKAITADLQADIKFGLMTYPAAGGTSPIPGFPLPASCGVGMLDVPIAPNNANAIAGALNGMQPSGGTPTSGTLQVAKGVIENTVNPDGVVSPKFVLLVTDGSPNCRNGNGSNDDPQAVVDSVNAIRDMTMMDIKTYVIGFQTAQNATLSAALDQMAVAGGTGDTMHRPVEDRDTLIAAFRDIAGKAVSCTFVLEKPTLKPDFIQVTVDGKQINLNDPNGWVLSPDGKQITLQGTACQNIQGAGQHTVNVQVKCEPVVPV